MSAGNDRPGIFCAQYLLLLDLLVPILGFGTVDRGPQNQNPSFFGSIDQNQVTWPPMSSWSLRANETGCLNFFPEPIKGTAEQSKPRLSSLFKLSSTGSLISINVASVTKMDSHEGVLQARPNFRIVVWLDQAKFYATNGAE
ncbi:hypothetical protein BDR04DRAFT_1158463 [Suillus decipiens]|nr:hypothetical protein BDR04DRAFT_1158463 [Suillus decipiens]